MFTHSVADILPPARFDGLPWTHVLVEEATMIDGPWTLIDEQTIPIDSTPATPNELDVTTTHATVQAGLLRFAFHGADGTPSPYGSPYLIPGGTPVLVGGQELPTGVTVEGFRSLLDVKNVPEDTLAGYLLGAASMAAALTKRTLVTEQGEADPPITIRRRPAGGRFLRVPDLRELTELKLDGVTVAIDDPDQDVFELITRPTNLPGPAVQIELLTRRPQLVEITGRFGWGALPQFLKDAIYAHAGRNYHERAALYADIVEDASGGAAYSYFRKLPPRVQAAYTQMQVPADTYGLV